MIENKCSIFRQILQCSVYIKHHITNFPCIQIILHFTIDSVVQVNHVIPFLSNLFGITFYFNMSHIYYMRARSMINGKVINTKLKLKVNGSNCHSIINLFLIYRGLTSNTQKKTPHQVFVSCPLLSEHPTGLIKTYIKLSKYIIMTNRQQIQLEIHQNTILYKENYKNITHVNNMAILF